MWSPAFNSSTIFNSTEYNSTHKTIFEPTPLTVSDYIEVAYNLTAIIIGFPINIWALHGHLKALRSRPAHIRLIWLGVHLTIANLLVLLVHSAGTVTWLLTQYWYGGDLLCRMFKFVSIMSFHISSNVVVSIALDMFSSLHSPLRNQMRDGRRRVRLLLMSSWILAVLLAMPQLYLWGALPLKELGDDQTYTYPDEELCEFLFANMTTFTRAYGIGHLICVFYVPLLFIVFCYVGSAYHVWKHLRLQSHLHEHCRHFGASATPQAKVSTAKNNGQYYSLNGQLNRTPSFQERRTRRRSSNVDRQTRTKMKLLRKSAGVILTYVVCWLPYQVFSVWQTVAVNTAEQTHLINTKVRWLEALMISCACINPFLYTFIRHRSSATASESPRRNSTEYTRHNSMFVTSAQQPVTTQTGANKQHTTTTSLAPARSGDAI